ncbi:agamous-like MADS-box protein AGL8 [Apium graveolens]|uniref:agamous-like MADS-box protein AGL8 n=1 Tax=Apium graveolens TaxID=4045 RepID=UPI003D791099
MGRGKVELKKIEDKSNRQVTFSKRRPGLLKKAKELSILCDVEVAVHIFAKSGKVFQFHSGESLRKIYNYLRNERRPKFGREAPSSTLHDTQETEPRIGTEHGEASTICEHLEEIQRQLEEQKVQHLKMAELNRMEHQLDGLLRLTRSTKEQAMRNAMSAIHEKDKGEREAEEVIEEQAP